MKKKLFKLISALTLSIMLLSVFSFAAFCSETEDAPDTLTDEPSATVTDQTENASDKATADESASGSEEQKDTNIFSSIFDGIELYLDEILSVLTLISSVLLMIIYKTGLLPVVKEGVSALSSKVKAISERTETLTKENDSFKLDASAGLKSCRDALDAMASSICEIEKKLDEGNVIKNEAKNGSEVLKLEVEMLYELFMASALPQYVKDRVGERIGEMRAMLSGGEE